MNILKKIVGTIVILLIALIQKNSFSQIIINPDIVSSLITFLSILFGFYITSLSIFVTSKFVSRLYKKIDYENKTRTLLDKLIKEYKFGLVFSLFTILYLIILQIHLIQQSTLSLKLEDSIFFPFSVIVIVNFIYGYRMLDTLIKVIIQEARISDK